jgi:uroporphyrinogen III methyltransferase / synthase
MSSLHIKNVHTTVTQLGKDDGDMKKGKVFLVGAGPGDVGLITVKGLEAIQKADVILYDRLANPKLLQFAPSTCEFIYCGKLPDRHTLRQEHINDLLVEKALDGKTVVRLKGGDPGVFGRVGEEAEALVTHDISFDIVPGISSGIAAPLYAGIPVTHRKFGESFAVVTAHDKSADGQPQLDWKGLATGIDTLAFYMGIGNLPFICENLIKHGKLAETPVIIIQWGTFGRQKTLEGTLGTIADKALSEKFSNPAITLVGDIISLRKKINWFEKKPLFGRQILLARTGTNESKLAKELSEQGADVYEYPKWKKNSIPVDFTILEKLKSYNHILFTSPECVDEFFQILVQQKIDVRTIKAEVFGASTKSIAALNEKGLIATHVNQMPKVGNLLIVSDHASSQNTAYQFDKSEIFLTSLKQIDEQFLPISKRIFEEANIDTIIFPSGQSITPFLQEIGKISANLTTSAKIICMGEQTLQTAEQLGLYPVGMPELPNRSSLLDFLTNT